MYKPIESVPRDCLVSVATRAHNVRTCWVRADGEMFYKNFHGQWHSTSSDPPVEWWDGWVPGWGYKRPPSPKNPKMYKL